MSQTDGRISMPEGYLKELKRSEERKAEISKYLQEYFPDQAKIIFEAGCGHGHWLTSYACLLYTSPSPRDSALSRMPSSA